MTDYGIDPEHDEHRQRNDVHYRLYDHPSQGPVVICVQWFDYHDYLAGRIMSPRAFDTEDEARAVLYGGSMIIDTPSGPRLYEFGQVTDV